MSLFKPFKGLSAALQGLAFHDGYAYLTTDDGKFSIDATDSNNVNKRICINPSATASVEGMMKKYTVSGTNTDGTMTQQAITAAIAAAAGQRPILGTEVTNISGNVVTYTDPNGGQIVTTFNNDGSITQVDTTDDSITYTTNITFSGDMVITSVTTASTPS